MSYTVKCQREIKCFQFPLAVSSTGFVSDVSGERSTWTDQRMRMLSRQILHEGVVRRTGHSQWIADVALIC